MSKKNFLNPGEAISKVLKETNKMQVYGLFSIFEKRIACPEESADTVIELLTNDPIAFDLLVQLNKPFRKGKKTDNSGNTLEFRAARTHEKFIEKVTLSGVLSAAPQSNFLATFISDEKSKKTIIYFLDLRNSK